MRKTIPDEKNVLRRFRGGAASGTLGTVMLTGS